MHPAKIRAVWSDSPQVTFWIAKDAQFPHADNKDWSDCSDMHADFSLHLAHVRRYVFSRYGPSLLCTENFGNCSDSNFAQSITHINMRFFLTIPENRTLIMKKWMHTAQNYNRRQSGNVFLEKIKLYISCKLWFVWNANPLLWTTTIIIIIIIIITSSAVEQTYTCIWFD